MVGLRFWNEQLSIFQSHVKYVNSLVQWLFRTKSRSTKTCSVSVVLIYIVSLWQIRVKLALSTAAKSYSVITALHSHVTDSSSAGFHLPSHASSLQNSTACYRSPESLQFCFVFLDFMLMWLLCFSKSFYLGNWSCVCIYCAHTASFTCSYPYVTVSCVRL